MTNAIMICAGIDTGKRKLDVALGGAGDRLGVANDPDGHAALSQWLGRHTVERIGIEASGGWEKAVVARLRQDGFTVVVFQPGQVKAYARFRLQRAKNDRIDAGLIACCTAAIETVHAAPDPRLEQLAPQLTMIDQLIEDVARFKTRRETAQDEAICQAWSEEIARLEKLVRTRQAELVTAIRRHDDLAHKLSLIASVDAIGLPTAVTILIRMPEIGTLTREQAAALAGLAPYDNDSGDCVGGRHIDGGRKRLRHALYNAAFAGAFRWNDRLKALYNRLTSAGKPHKLALVACARKLIIFANAVVARGTPWGQSLSSCRQTKPSAA